MTDYATYNRKSRQLDRLFERQERNRGKPFRRAQQLADAIIATDAWLVKNAPIDVTTYEPCD